LRDARFVGTGAQILPNFGLGLSFIDSLL
jgi:hypothetical protein